MDKQKILNQAKIMKNWLTEIRRDFHKHPELSMEEFRTQKKIIKYLEEMGINNIYKVAQTGVVAIIKGEKPGKTVALRADMDALPIQDNKETLYKSLTKGIMHACGHDAHMTILLGAAKMLKSMEKEFKGTVKLFFQPAEETIGGAKIMIESGVLENPKVDTVIGLHVSPEIPVGQVGVKYDQMNASSDSIKIIIHGISTHGAYPHEGIDAIVVAGQVITALQSIVSRNIDPRDSAVVTLGTISGGTRGNIIANKVEMTGTIRTLDNHIRSSVIKNLTNIVKNVSEGLGARGQLIVEEGYPHLVNSNKAVKMVEENARKLLGKENVNIIRHPSLGVEDFSYFLREIDGAFYRLGCRNEKTNVIHPTHNDLFDIDEDCLPIGVALQVSNALQVLSGKNR